MSIYQLVVKHHSNSVRRVLVFDLSTILVLDNASEHATLFTDMKNKYDNIIDRAMDFATKKHSGQLDDSGKDYMIHPIQVAAILGQVTDDDNLIAAALLHDTIEDTETTYADLYIEFGKDIADLVNEVSHEGSKDNNGYYFPRLETQRGIMLKFADRLSNISRMDAWPEERKEYYLKKSKFWKDKI